jgi:hypothetical protein
MATEPPNEAASALLPSPTATPDPRLLAAQAELSAAQSEQQAAALRAEIAVLELDAVNAQAAQAERWQGATATANALYAAAGVNAANADADKAHYQQMLGVTVTIAALTLVANFTFGIVIGIISAVRQNSFLDRFLTVTALFFYSMPEFWFALMMIIVFALKLQWFPASGSVGRGLTAGFNWPYISSVAYHAILPATAIVIASVRYSFPFGKANRQPDAAFTTSAPPGRRPDKVEERSKSAS